MALEKRRQVFVGRSNERRSIRQAYKRHQAIRRGLSRRIQSVLPPRITFVLDISGPKTKEFDIRNIFSRPKLIQTYIFIIIIRK